jgi:sugar phosphate isomerase/epimerase
VASSHLFCALGAGALLFAATAQSIQWRTLSSKKGELPVPGPSKQQTGALAVRVDPGGGTDFVLSFRQVAPALVWYRRDDKGWTRHVIEPEFLRVEAGGAAHDIDGDGDLDLVFGGDGQSDQLWWWENPWPDFKPDARWTRRMIKSGGGKQHHDQAFADVKGTGKPQLIFWNQKAKTLFLAEIPKDPRNAGPWTLEPIYTGQAGEGVENAAAYAEGVHTYDVDSDGRPDVLAGNYWFHYAGGKFTPVKIGSIGGRIKAGRFIESATGAQVAIAPVDGSGPLRFYEAKGDPKRSDSWVGRDLLEREMVHGHTLDIGDVNGDGHLDIFAAEMAKWSNTEEAADHPKATAWILYGDGKGGFTKTVLKTGDGWHEGKLGDFDHDGDLDVLNKPYTWDAPRVDLWLNNGTGKILPLKAGMELWTYRAQLARDLPGMLGMIRRLGIRDIETASLYGRSAAEFRKALDAAGLTCSSYIASYDALKKDLAAVAADAKALGAKYVLTAGMPRKGQLTEANVRSAAADFNEWGAKLKQQGLRFGYHAHGFEFVPHGGGTLFDLLLKETKPELVTQEMDVFWFVHGGADPVKYLKQYPGRFELMHVQDMAAGTPTGRQVGKAPKETSVAMGEGKLDWKAILPAAKQSGVRLYYIEDESPAAPDQMPETVRYLKRAGF